MILSLPENFQRVDLEDEMELFATKKIKNKVCFFRTNMKFKLLANNTIGFK